MKKPIRRAPKAPTAGGSICQDPKDDRDQVYKCGPCRDRVDLREYLYPVENQRKSQACCGFAASNLIEVLLRMYHPEQAREHSPLFVWWNARRRERTLGQNIGVYSRTVMKTLHQEGICPRDLWPFIGKLYHKRPPAKAFRAGERIRIQGYQRCTSRKAVRSALSAGLPVFVGILLREGYLEIKGPLETHPAQFRALRDRPTTEGHFLTLIGYRPEGALIVNSWGRRYGDEGFYLMPWSVLMRDQFDIWVATGMVVGDTKGKARRVKLPDPTAPVSAYATPPPGNPYSSADPRPTPP